MDISFTQINLKTVFLIGKHLGEEEEAACFNYGMSKVFMKYKIPLLKMK